MRAPIALQPTSHRSTPGRSRSNLGWSSLSRPSFALLLALGLSSCAVVPPAGISPSGPASQPVPSVSPSTPLGTPTPSATDVSPSATPSVSGSPTTTPSAPATALPAKGKGKLVLYQENLVSDQMTGTCQRKDGKPTLHLSDNATDFFESVEVKVVLTEAADAAVSVDMDFGADSESITHTLTARGNGQGGTSVKLSRTGESFKVTGTGTMTDDGKVSANAVPFAITVTCASVDW